MSIATKTNQAHRLLASLLAVFVFSATGCTANKKPSKLETWLANMAKDVAIPLEAQKVVNPVAKAPEVIQEGEHVYMASCSMCHGTDGHAQTGLGRGLYPPAMDLTSPHVQHWNDSELFWIIQNGVRLTGMPAWKNMLSESDSWKLVHFIRELPKQPSAAAAPPVTPPASSRSPAEWMATGKMLYRQEGCLMCHRMEGEGAEVGPDLTEEGKRGRTDDWLIGHFKDPAAYTPGSVMPPFKNLTDDQLRALVAFLQSQKGKS